MAECCFEKCTSGKEGVLSPVIMLYASKHTVPACASLTLVVCQDCADTLKPEDLISDAGWLQICAGMRAAGKFEPKRSLTKIAFETIAHREEVFAKIRGLEAKRNG